MPRPWHSRGVITRRLLRRIAFIGAAAYMLLTPAWVQVLGGKPGSLPAWRMFHTRGNGMCSVRYFDHGRRLDRYAVMGLSRASAPAEFRVVKDPADAQAIGRTLCERRGAGAEVRVELRCFDKQAGFRTLLDREADLCAAP